MTHEERFDRIDANIDRLGERLEASVVSLNAKIDKLGDRLDGDIARLSKFVLDFREETIRRLDVSDTRLEIISGSIGSMEARFPLTSKSLLDFGKHTS